MKHEQLDVVNVKPGTYDIASIPIEWVNEPLSILDEECFEYGDTTTLDQNTLGIVVLVGKGGEERMMVYEDFYIIKLFMNEPRLYVVAFENAVASASSSLRADAEEWAKQWEKHARCEDIFNIGEEVSFNKSDVVTIMSRWDSNWTGWSRGSREVFKGEKAQVVFRLSYPGWENWYNVRMENGDFCQVNNRVIDHIRDVDAEEWAKQWEKQGMMQQTFDDLKNHYDDGSDTVQHPPNLYQKGVAFIEMLVAGGIPLDEIDINDWANNTSPLVYVRIQNPKGEYRHHQYSPHRWTKWWAKEIVEAWKKSNPHLFSPEEWEKQWEKRAADPTKAFVDAVREAFRDRAELLFEKAGIDRSKYEGLSFLVLDQDKFAFAPITAAITMPRKDVEAQPDPVTFVDEHFIDLAHELGHYLDMLVRGPETIVEERKELPEGASKMEYNMQPSEALAYLREMQVMRKEGFTDDEIIDLVTESYEGNRPFVTGLLAMARTQLGMVKTARKVLKAGDYVVFRPMIVNAYMGGPQFFTAVNEDVGGVIETIFYYGSDDKSQWEYVVMVRTNDKEHPWFRVNAKPEWLIRRDNPAEWEKQWEKHADLLGNILETDDWDEAVRWSNELKGMTVREPHGKPFRVTKVYPYTFQVDGVYLDGSGYLYGKLLTKDLLVSEDSNDWAKQWEKVADASLQLWVEPDGTEHPVDSSSHGHWGWLVENKGFLKKYGIDFDQILKDAKEGKRTFQFGEGPMEDVLSAGWARMSGVGNFEVWDIGSYSTRSLLEGLMAKYPSAQYRVEFFHPKHAWADFSQQEYHDEGLTKVVRDAMLFKMTLGSKGNDYVWGLESTWFDGSGEKIVCEGTHVEYLEDNGLLPPIEEGQDWDNINFDELVRNFIIDEGWTRVTELQGNVTGERTISAVTNRLPLPESVKAYIEEKRPAEVRIETLNPQHVDIVAFDEYLEKYASTMGMVRQADDSWIATWIDSDGEIYEDVGSHTEWVQSEYVDSGMMDIDKYKKMDPSDFAEAICDHLVRSGFTRISEWGKGSPGNYQISIVYDRLPLRDVVKDFVVSRKPDIVTMRSVFEREEAYTSISYERFLDKYAAVSGMTRQAYITDKDLRNIERLYDAYVKGIKDEELLTEAKMSLLELSSDLVAYYDNDLEELMGLAENDEERDAFSNNVNELIDNIGKQTEIIEASRDFDETIIALDTMLSFYHASGQLFDKLGDLIYASPEVDMKEGTAIVRSIEALRSLAQKLFEKGTKTAGIANGARVIDEKELYAIKQIVLKGGGKEPIAVQDYSEVDMGIVVFFHDNHESQTTLPLAELSVENVRKRMAEKDEMWRKGSLRERIVAMVRKGGAVGDVKVSNKDGVVEVVYNTPD